MPTYSQEGRLLAIDTPLGKDELLLTGFYGREAVSRLFSFQLDLLSEKPDIEAKDIVGKPVTFAVYPGQSTRYFNGVVSRFAMGGMQINDLRFYRAEVVPWLWFLTRTADCRIFQNKTVPEIIQQIFKDSGFTDFKLALKGDHAKRDYCVQYRETDFNFVSRLMEEEGIFYFFQHDDGKHTMMIDDQKSAYKDCAEKEVRFYAGTIEESHLTHWEHQFEFRAGKWAQTDYNFETPSTSLMTRVNTVVKLPGVDKFEIYDYPGDYLKKANGDVLTKVRMEEDEVAHDLVHASSNCASFYPIGKFKLTDHPCSSEAGKSYVVTDIQHSASDDSYTPSARGDQDYKNTFACIPDSVQYRPARVTPKPVVQGVQPAIVVGPAGEEIHTDKYGRVKVQFYWDREGKKDDNSSCWIRVSQAYAGGGWGSICIPRIGQEVIVDFVEGDPDRPIITGRVYNAEQMPPFALPGDKVVSGLKSNSSPGGGGYNEFIMNDTKGNELIREHGQFDKDSTIEHDLREHVLHDRSRDVTNNETILIGNDRTETVNGNESLTVHKNRTETVDINETLSVGADRTRSVGANESVTVALMRTHTVGINEAITVGAAQEITVGAIRTVTVGASQTVTIGTSETVTIGTSQTVGIGTNLSESIGKDHAAEIGNNRSASVTKEDTLKVGTKLTIDAGEQISIKTGAASILMKKDGTIMIQGKDITIKGSGEMIAKADKNITMKGQKILQN
jgi:type VI secretion system secreted protein VgrG